MFLVIIPIHDGSNESSEKGSEVTSNFNFGLTNVNNDGNKANYRLKTLVDSVLFAIFVEILQNQG